MNLVSREEFDEQCRVLEETRVKLATLESRLEELQSD
jgi:BMFP domain-containing protein YqiC